MKYLLLIFFLLFVSSTLFANVTMKKTISRPSLPIEKPERPIVKLPLVKPVVNTGVVYQDNYYNTNVENNCQQYMDQLNEKESEIAALKQEIDRLKAIEAKHLQDTLKAKHDKEMSAFDNRKNSVRSKNSISIIDK